MKKSVLSLFFCVMLVTLNAQDTTKIVYPVKAKKPAIDLSGRANDHLMFQFGWAGWSG
jgi:hypothetical protein